MINLSLCFSFSAKEQALKADSRLNLSVGVDLLPKPRFTVNLFFGPHKTRVLVGISALQTDLVPTAINRKVSTAIHRREIKFTGND